MLTRPPWITAAASPLHRFPREYQGFDSGPQQTNSQAIDRDKRLVCREPVLTIIHLRSSVRSVTVILQDLVLIELGENGGSRLEHGAGENVSVEVA